MLSSKIVIRPSPFGGEIPEIHETAYVDGSAQVVGRVRVGARSSIWMSTVVRGDVNVIEIGADTNVQDLCCLHVFRDRFPLRLGDRVSVGHSVTLHGCTVGDGALVAIGSVVLDGVEIGAESLVAAGSLLTPGMKVPPRSLVMGSPARVKRPLSEGELALLDRTWRSYVGYAQVYREKFGRGF